MQNLLGSAGKSETSGDIDINMEITQFDKFALVHTLTEVLGEFNVKDKTSVNQIFTCVPIQGDPSHGFVQIDFMFGNREWQEFSYWSPGPQSKFKGLFRTELLKAAVAFNSDWTKFENNELIARVGPTFFHDRGLIWRYRHKPERRDGKPGRIKAFKELTETDFFKLYPDAINATHRIIDTPTGVSELIFGDADALGYFESYELLSDKLKTFYGAESYAIIMTMFEERLNSLKVDIPKDIVDEILTATDTAFGATRNGTSG